MKKGTIWCLFLSLLWLLNGCATIDKPEVKAIDNKPQVSPAPLQQNLSAKKGLKRKVAIARFTNETKYGQSFFLDEQKDRIGKQAVDILTNKLMQTDKFIMLERADLDKLQKELALGNAAPLRNMADYLIVGSISEFGRKDTGEVGIFSRTKRQTAFAKVHIRMIDIYTGQVIYSEDGEGSAFSEAGTVFGVGGRAGYDSTLNDKALEAAITNLASNIIERLLDKPWRGYILGQEDNQLIISGGKSQNINAGDVFTVYQEGKKVKNPQTNMEMTLPAKKIAKIQVTATLGETAEKEVSLCKVIEGERNLADYQAKNDYSRLFIGEAKEGL
ncbi:MAG TPA: CsgG/HfaB family protein [Syntrophales bacterium]|jgi:curli biogenesis system outer membrane secretion channel CsgG|nr:CsgG/HfaB family protein [Syntrophales bacterium]HON22636.1 CsgG/HfaB family protein [Syntrophales bacterium]HOU76896.1 CsgG/HfaB family protein [Syntrophales bacterium]HPC31665.1 CsgG/HfaB family protein [Syntrophales bacterium]HQG34280.1 CsgG/HfaB family protein [Syntrophales bacterium]